MKLAECRIGTVVCMKADVVDTNQLVIGHIVGLENPDVPRRGLLILGSNFEQRATSSRVWPRVKFCGYVNDVVISFDDIELFTAY